MYNIDLFCKLYEIFPDAFQTTKESSNYDYVPGPFGVETVFAGTETVNLAACILNTAQAMTHGGTDVDRGLSYINSFAGKYAQRQVIRGFLKS